MDNEFEGKVDEAKGRAEEAAGDLTGRDDLRREGKVDEETGKARQKLDEAADKGGEALDEVADKAQDVIGSDDDGGDAGDVEGGSQ
jgi:uncharacterized protein YjbJ (UPF0337 family)